VAVAIGEGMSGRRDMRGERESMPLLWMWSGGGSTIVWRRWMRGVVGYDKWRRDNVGDGG
jgi:hypothetical protein